MSIVNGSLQVAGGDNSFFTAHATAVPLLRQPVFNTQTGQFKIGDGVTQLQNLPYYTLIGGILQADSSITGAFNLNLGTQASPLNALTSHSGSFDFEAGTAGSIISLSPTILLTGVSLDAVNYVLSQITTAGQTVSDTSTNNRYVIRDDIGLKGLVGYADYSSNVTNNSYIQKSWVQPLLDSKVFAFTCAHGPTVQFAANATVYWSNWIFSASSLRSTAGQALTSLPYNATLVGATITTWNASSGTSQTTSTVYFRYNGSDSAISSNVLWSASAATPVQHSITGLNVAVSAGVGFEIKLIMGNLATPPTNSAQCTVDLYFKL